MRKVAKKLSVFLVLLVLLLPREQVLGASSNQKEELLRTAENATLEKLKEDHPEPAYGAECEWTVFSLARSGALPPDDPYFSAYYEALKSSAKGKFSSTRSTENSRVILALSAIGKSAENVNGVNLVKPYADAEWVGKQGVNGEAFALLAMDAGGYDTPDGNFRDACIQRILAQEKPGGGFALMGDVADSDITSMVLTALAPYREREDVAAAGERAIAALSEMELPDGNFITLSFATSFPTASSAAQVLVALSAWGIDADTDPRFKKSEGSVVDALLSFYVDAEDGPGFMNAKPGTNDQSTTAGKRDPIASYQGAYALTAYRRFKEGRPALYDFSDVTIEKAEPAKEGHAALFIGIIAGAVIVCVLVVLLLRRKSGKRTAAL